MRIIHLTLLSLSVACDGPKEPVDSVSGDDSDGGDDSGPAPYSCGDTITAPSQVAAELSGLSPGNLVDVAVTAAVDTSCLSDCVGGISCKEAACVTSAGVDLSYKKLVEEIEVTDDVRVVRVTIDATLFYPEGGALSELSMHQVRDDTDYLAADSGQAHTAEFGATWTGTLHEALPTEGVLSQTEHMQSDDCCVDTEITNDVNGCVTRFVYKAPVGDPIQFIERSGQRVVYWHQDVWIDDACYGQVDSLTFERVGDCVYPDDPPPE